jgi:hypothetical protein
LNFFRNFKLGPGQPRRWQGDDWSDANHPQTDDDLENADDEEDNTIDTPPVKVRKDFAGSLDRGRGHVNMGPTAVDRVHRPDSYATGQTSFLFKMPLFEIDVSVTAVTTSA